MVTSQIVEILGIKFDVYLNVEYSNNEYFYDLNRIELEKDITDLSEVLDSKVVHNLEREAWKKYIQNEAEYREE